MRWHTQHWEKRCAHTRELVWASARKTQRRSIKVQFALVRPAQARWPALATTPSTISPPQKAPMNITLQLVPIVSLIAGILILAVPRLLSTIVAIYLIVVGLVGLFGSGQIFK